MSGPPAELLEDLRRNYGGALLVDQHEVAPFVVDWRKQWTGTCLAVAVPDSVQQISALVRWCATRRVPIVAQGGNTGLSGAATPDDSGMAIVLSLVRLNNIRSVDSVNNTMTVDAGVLLANVQTVAQQHDRLFPLSLAAEGSCTIGGNLATNAGGTAVLRYGNARELCLGLEVVTATGDVWDGLRALRKDNTGYDLRDLFIGSEGTLGVITGAVLKLFPRPAGHGVALVAVESFAKAVALFDRARSSLDTALVACEVMNRTCIELVTAHMTSVRCPLPQEAPWIVLLDVVDMNTQAGAQQRLEELLSHSIDSGDAVDAAVAQSIDQAQQFWMIREHISEAQAAFGPAIKHDISVPLSSLSEFVEQANAAVSSLARPVQLVTFGHLGDGNLHYNLSPTSGADHDQFRASLAELNVVVHDLVRSFNGSVSAEHGLGVLRRDEADRFRSSVERQLQRSIKFALDPQGIFNPGKFLPASDL
jgi:FAD/FMN-containing dehydrogenase